MDNKWSLALGVGHKAESIMLKKTAIVTETV